MKGMVVKGDKGKTGRKGEDLVCRWLASHGHTILERNWRYGHLEIDIISYDTDGIHFVEVKSRNTPFEAEPQDCVTAQKQKNIIRAAGAYMATGRQDEAGYAECFFDVAAVVFEDGKTMVRYFPEAFLPIY